MLIIEQLNCYFLKYEYLFGSNSTKCMKNAKNIIVLGIKKMMRAKLTSFCPSSQRKQSWVLRISFPLTTSQDSAKLFKPKITFLTPIVVDLESNFWVKSFINFRGKESSRHYSIRGSFYRFCLNILWQNKIFKKLKKIFAEQWPIY